MRLMFSRNKRMPALSVALLLFMVLAIGLSNSASSQPPPPPTGEQPAMSTSTNMRNRSIEGFDSKLPLVPQSPPHDWSNLTGFAEKLSSNDAVIEVVARQGRILTLREDLSREGALSPVIAVGDPTVIDFRLVGPRQIRIIGQRIGTTDLSITTADGEPYTFEVRVTADLELLRARLQAIFPDATLSLRQIREHLIVSGEARSALQVQQIIDTIDSHLRSIQNSQVGTVQGRSRPGQAPTTSDGGQPGAAAPANGQDAPPQTPAQLSPDEGNLQTSAQILEPQIVNLIRVPGPQQVLLKVQIAELNRTALRQMGGDLEVDFSDLTSVFRFRTDTLVSPAPGFPIPTPGFPNPTSTTQGVRIFDHGSVTYIVKALQRNNILKILAEPNLVALNGHEASFLAGGEFPIPVPQSGSGGGTVITIDFREFGVRLRFTPTIIDEHTIRLKASPEVSAIDSSLAISVEGFNVPALSTRNATTVVEMSEGQTLAIAGLLQVQLRGEISGVPGLTNIPVLGRFFSNNTSESVEKELVVLVTPYLVEAVNGDELPLLPGAEVDEPNNLEFYLFGRTESKTLHGYRSTTDTFHPPSSVRLIKLEERYFKGQHGFSQ